MACNYQWNIFLLDHLRITMMICLKIIGNSRKISSKEVVSQEKKEMRFGFWFELII